MSRAWRPTDPPTPEEALMAVSYVVGSAVALFLAFMAFGWLLGAAAQ